MSKSIDKDLSNKNLEEKGEKFSLIFFIISTVILVTLSSFTYGVTVGKFKVFPYKLLAEAERNFKAIRVQLFGQRPDYYKPVDKRFLEVVSQSGQPYQGLTLVTKMAADHNLSAEIIDLKGKTVHKWDIDWFKMWPDPQHLSGGYIPKVKPGTSIHGAVVLENGDLVFNFEKQGLIRIDRKGEVVWRLPYQTHHSVHRDDEGNLWVSGGKHQMKSNSRWPNIVPPFFEDTILKVTPEGKILREWFIADLLRKNGYAGLLYLGSLKNGKPIAEDFPDVFHLNDVEPFSSKLQEGFFKQGDVLVSLRNINTVFVFNAESEEIKFLIIGPFVRQHDPDFIDGNTFSVFDNNNNMAEEPELRQSRIVIVSAKDNTSKVFFKGTLEKPFFTNIMGKHQWQPNGNLLITDSKSGRGFEINQQGDIVWQYINYVDEGLVADVSEVQRLPIEYTPLFQEE